MFACKLKQNPDGSWTALVTETREEFDVSFGGNSLSSVRAKIDKKSLDECSALLVRYGVEDDEIDEAVIAMNAREHNLAHFGWFGSFMFSEYEGILN